VVLTPLFLIQLEQFMESVRSSLPEQPPSPPRVVFDFSGYDLDERLGMPTFVICQKCKIQWAIPRCWVGRMPLSCAGLLAQHRLKCQSVSPGGIIQKE
jgi:hypothetical protein